MWILTILKAVNAPKALITLIALLLLFIIGFGAGYKIAKWREDAAYKQQYVAAIAKISELQDQSQKRAQIYAQQLDLYRKNQISPASIAEETTKHDVYGKCIVPTSGVQYLNTSVDASNTAHAS